MRIIGFTIEKVLGQRKGPKKGKIEIKSNIDILDIQKETIPISDKPALKFDFSFKVDYEPKYANIEINGSIMVLDDDDQGKTIIKDWKKKKLAPSVQIPLFNFIMNKCNLRSLQLEEELSLPTHIPMPKLRPQQQDNQANKANYAG